MARPRKTVETQDQNGKAGEQSPAKSESVEIPAGLMAVFEAYPDKEGAYLSPDGQKWHFREHSARKAWGDAAQFYPNPLKTT